MNLAGRGFLEAKAQQLAADPDSGRAVFCSFLNGETTHIERAGARVYRDEEQPSNVAAHAMLTPAAAEGAPAH